MNKAISSEKLDFNIEVVEVSEGRIDIIVTVISGEPEFIYSLWNKEPWENGKEIENSGKTITTVYTFNNLKAKPYFVMVSDKDGLKHVKQIQITD